MEKISRVRVERIVCMYASNKDVSQVLGITEGRFGRIIETPYARH